ncbi:GNAT family N-acetyltransferase [Nocardiopsis sp. CC223A]|uniref:GNAT family N-acetyltransferase n=1 Tax=Nocardiopsis sp. CC223A TaxID=3044051 RepID=UPI00278BE2EE|nr:GNAT family N-acetyltransferase [Nocardiopsis sp. CC223A]
MTAGNGVPPRIRRAVPADAPAIAAVHVASWHAAYHGLIAREHLANLDADRLAGIWARRLGGALTLPGAGCLVAEGPDGVVAYSGFVPGTDPDDADRTVADLETFYSLPGVWGTGVNRRLWEETLAAMTAGGTGHGVLWVLEGNARARRFYTATGWRDTGAVTPTPILGGALTVPAVLYRRDL